MGDVADQAISFATLGMVDTDFSGQDAAKDVRRATEGAAATQAEYQREALDYLKEREQIPQQFREQALTRLGGLAGLEGGEGSQAEMIERAKASPLYGALLRSGDEASARVRSMKGLTRSGTAISDTQEAQDRALLTALNQEQQQLQGLAGLPSMAPQIAQTTAGIGQTLAQGQIASAQGQIAAQNMGMNQLLGLGQTGLTAAAVFSDIRLKEDIEPIGKVGGYTWFKWKWNDMASTLGLHGESEGVMAHDVYDLQPEIIGHKDGFITVDYSQLDSRCIDGEFKGVRYA